MNRYIIDLHYLPSITYFGLIADAHELVLEAQEYYPKQTYRNRCQILAANKVDTLSVPVQHTPVRARFRDVKIDYNQKWLNVHWRAIASAYGKAPYFEYFADDFKAIFEKKHQFLFEFNTELLSLCLKLLRKKVVITETLTYQSFYDDTKDYRNLINPKVDKLSLKFIPYQQNFGKEFVPNLSIIDLLFCEGANACNFLPKSMVEPYQTN